MGGEGCGAGGMQTAPPPPPPPPSARTRGLVGPIPLVVLSCCSSLLLMATSSLAATALAAVPLGRSGSGGAAAVAAAEPPSPPYNAYLPRVQGAEPRRIGVPMDSVSRSDRRERESSHHGPLSAPAPPPPHHEEVEQGLRLFRSDEKMLNRSAVGGERNARGAEDVDEEREVGVAVGDVEGRRIVAVSQPEERKTIEGWFDARAEASPPVVTAREARAAAGAAAAAAKAVMVGIPDDQGGRDGGLEERPPTVADGAWKSGEKEAERYSPTAPSVTTFSGSGELKRWQQQQQQQQQQRHTGLRGSFFSLAPPPSPPPQLPPPSVVAYGPFGGHGGSGSAGAETMEAGAAGIHTERQEKHQREEGSEEGERTRARTGRGGSGADEEIVIADALGVLGVPRAGIDVVVAGGAGVPLLTAVRSVGEETRTSSGTEGWTLEEEEEAEEEEEEEREIPTIMQQRQRRRRRRVLAGGVDGDHHNHGGDGRALMSSGSESPVRSGAPATADRGQREQQWKRQQRRVQKQQQQQQQQSELARSSRALEEDPRTFPGAQELQCTLTVLGNRASQGGPAVFEPTEGYVLVVGTTTNVSWSLDIFEAASSSATSEGSSGATSTGNSLQEVDVGKVNVTLFNGDADVQSVETNNTGLVSFEVPSDLEEAFSYRVAVWDASSGLCGISSEFGISGELSINVTEFAGFNEERTVDMSPLLRGVNASVSGNGGEIYSCGGSVRVGWSFTGLVESVDVRVCQEPNNSGSLAGLEDEDLQNPTSPTSEGGEFFTCLEPIGNNVPANLSLLNATLLPGSSSSSSSSTCGVWGEGFFARVSWADGGDGDVSGLSTESVGGDPVVVLGGVFVRPDDTTTISVYESQLIKWEGQTASGDNAEVDIILRRNNSDDAYYIVAEGYPVSSRNGEFPWENPSAVFSDDELVSSEMEKEVYYLELFDAVWGGLICRSKDFILTSDGSSSNESDTSTLLLLLTLAALLLLCCCGVFFVACPYYKIVRSRSSRQVG
ncbi:unnamed protein product [Pylaiella littoralis]